ncbi:4Fe-4S ferredoxin, iron-sulfur binding domain protein [Alkaliphilus metalliredigens QYMF]|uniref:4Fe-4S ferredoxin, iron-sulfur binding domain protein n=1 Tax=Alkaliphilus metalliredigens (strain QYMF) TaxID=293826 RepID=A6TNM2_ALKMQ|nr:4Fe-4S double cluster binding domain-containing protein [Alkaliphilus metalliredigens]ABR47790.1 4Fe-4S ferredoxin, iron-sulfur binding domain protein [Alkaliphilus metalliredigens QYMF]
MNQQESLTKTLLELGVAKVGYSHLEDVLPDEFKHLKSGVTIAIRLSDQIISDINIETGPTHTYFHHYRTANAFIDQVTFKIMTILQQWEHLAMAIPASQSINIEGWHFKSLFPHRTAATRSGMGWIGKNSCLVTEEFGPRVRLGTVLTNMEFQYDEPIKDSQCGDCDLCVRNCPALALKGTLWKPGLSREEMFDANKCSKHMKSEYKHIGRGAVCGICIKSCPKGNAVLKT